jgi:uncharacterized membrane protein YfcA
LSDLVQLSLVIIICFLASLIQSLTGFGSALVAMPLLTRLLGLHLAAPLTALLSLIIEAVLLIRYRRSLNLKLVWRLILGLLVGIPLGFLALRTVPERAALALLSVVILGYAAYALLNLKLPKLAHPIWAYTVGLLAGLLGGAYNTTGPPVIIYGDTRRWEPTEFKANLQGFFIIGSIWISLNHAIGGNLTPPLWQNFLTAVVPILLGLWLGSKWGQDVNPATFRRIVLWLLVILGLQLLF